MLRFIAAALVGVSLASCEAVPVTSTNTVPVLQQAYNYCGQVLRSSGTRGGQAYARDSTITQEAWSQCGTSRPTMAPALPSYEPRDDYRYNNDRNYGYDNRSRPDHAWSYDDRGKWCYYKHQDLNGSGFKCY